MTVGGRNELSGHMLITVLQIFCCLDSSMPIKNVPTKNILIKFYCFELNAEE